ncbi:MAG: prevent-host-death family protein [Enterovirga sp.]|jgi:prevent-host-death family protein|nr:prevent-host-death family protein [Enterovirga sp.]
MAATGRQARSPTPSVAEPREATVHEAKTHLSRLLAEVEAGGTVIITRRGKPVAKLEPLSPRGPRRPGSMKGLISIDERFFDPLPEDELRAWEGD